MHASQVMPLGSGRMAVCSLRSITFWLNAVAETGGRVATRRCRGEEGEPVRFSAGDERYSHRHDAHLHIVPMPVGREVRALEGRLGECDGA